MHALLSLLLHRCCNFALDDPYLSLLLPGCCQALSTTALDHSKLARHSVDRRSLDTDSCCYVLSKRSKRPPHMAPSLIVSGPKSSSKIDLGRAKIKPKSPRERPEAPNSAQECPRAPHERSKTGPRAVPESPRVLQERPRVPRSAPRVPQERQSRPQGTFQGGLEDFWEPFCGLQLEKKRLSQTTGRATRLRSVFGSIFG